MDMTQVATYPAAAALNASKIYGKDDSEVRALDDVTVDFQLGHFTAIMGPSGSGKGTLMHCLAGLDSLTSGSVCIGDTDLAQLDDKQLTTLRREKVGFIFQAYNLIPTLTALENITLPMDLGGVKPDQEWLDTVIDKMNLRNRLSHRPSELSGGQQQRVAIARTLAAKPALILADEPTGNLDSANGENILRLLRELTDETQTALVLVTHSEEAAAICHRRIHLRDGRVVS